MQSEVFFTDLETGYSGSRLDKLDSLIRKAGLDKIDMERKFVAIKLHFGELGNLSFLRHNYAKVIVDYVKERGGIPFLTDCNTLYVGKRKKTAAQHAPLVIAERQHAALVARRRGRHGAGSRILRPRAGEKMTVRLKLRTAAQHRQ